MKRFLIVLMLFGMVAGTLATAEAKKKPSRVERTVVGYYDGPFVPQVTGCTSLRRRWACLSVETRRTESFFSAKVTDAHGQPVFVQVMEYREGEPGSRMIATFCGETTRPISFDPGVTLDFFVGFYWIGPLHCPTQRIATTGTISVTLSNLP